MNTRTGTSPLGDLLRSLDGLGPEDVTQDSVSAMLSAVEATDRALAPFLDFRDDRYTRNLVRRTPLFDVIVLCWRPGHVTPIHNHDGQRGWVRVVRGALEEVAYETTAPGAHAAEDACLSLKSGKLIETTCGVVHASEAVVTVDTERAIHRLGNPAPAGGENAVSLHVYSKPHDTCLVFDEKTGRVERRRLEFDSRPE